MKLSFRLVTRITPVSYPSEMRRIPTQVLQEFEASASPRPRAGDWVLAAVVAGASLAEVIFRDDMTWPFPSLAAGLLLASMMVLRRSRPLAAITVVVCGFGLLNVAAAALTETPISLYAGGFVLVLVYSLPRWADTLGSVMGMGLVALLWAFSVSTDASGIDEAIGGALLLLLAAAIGLAVRYRAIIWSQQVDHIRSLERESLARELHDTVAHHVSGIAVAAQAGRVLASTGNTDGAVAALGVIEQEASLALSDMRSMVTTLRRDKDAPHRSLPAGVDDILALATPAGSLDQPVVEVDVHGDVVSITPAILRALHRVVQESVTNARRHARRIHVLLDAGPREVRVSVTDDGESSPSVARPPGYGLIGMTERITLLGGSLRAGPLPEGGWQVEAIIPRDGGRQ